MILREAIMEPLFENKLVLTKEVYFQFINRALRLTLRLFLFVGLALLAFSLISMILTTPSGIFIGLIVFGAILIFLALSNARLSANRIYKQQLAVHGHEPENSVLFSDIIRGIGANKAESIYQYSQIAKIYETRDLIILMMSKSVALLLKKDGFTIGSYEGFKTFIKEKCPDIKIKK
jgi:hypothetical protein